MKLTLNVRVYYILENIIKYFKPLHAVYRIQQGKQRERSVKTLSSESILPNTQCFQNLEAWWVAELNVVLFLDTRVKVWKYKFKNIFNFLEWRSNPQPIALWRRSTRCDSHFVPLRHDWLQKKKPISLLSKYTKIKIYRAILYEIRRVIYTFFTIILRDFNFEILF